MGARTQVLIEDEGVYLYSHWGSEDIMSVVAKAIAKKWRWDDPEYLARIIFDEMKGDDFEETGYGIGTSKHGDLDNFVVVNCKNKTVTYHDKYIHPEKAGTHSFESMKGFID